MAPQALPLPPKKFKIGVAALRVVYASSERLALRQPPTPPIPPMPPIPSALAVGGEILRLFKI